MTKVTIVEVVANEEMIKATKNAMKKDWTNLVASGECTLYEMIESLEAQIEKNRRGWDCSYEEFEIICENLGWDIVPTEGEETDVADNEWRRVVQETAKEWLDTFAPHREVEKKMQEMLVNNLRDVAHNYWEQEEQDESDRLNLMADRIENMITYCNYFNDDKGDLLEAIEYCMR